MNKNNSMLITNIMVLIAGLILIMLNDRVNIMEEIISIVGIMFTIPSIFSLAFILIKKNKEQRVDNFTPIMVSSVGSLVFGLFLIITPGLFVGFLIYLFAGLLLLGGLYHIIFIAFLRKKVVMPMWFFILPSLMVIMGVTILFTNIQVLEKSIVLITGISMICFAVNSLFEYIGMRAINRERRIN